MISIRLTKLLLNPCQNLAHGASFTTSKRFSSKGAVSNLSYEKFPGDGQRSPLVILHGLLGNKNNWKSLAKALSQAAHRTIYTVDARNHGSSPHVPDMTYPLMGADIVEFLRERGHTSAAVMGHSMGGRAAMAAALMRPDVVEELLVLDISPFGVSDSISTLPRFVELMRRIPLSPELTLQAARKEVDTALKKLVPEMGIRQFLLTNLYQSDTTGEFLWRANLGAISRTFNPHICTFPLDECGAVYEGPTTFIGGANSDYIKPLEHDAIRGVFPSALFHYIDGAGHWLHADKPSDFLQLVTPIVT